MGDSSKTTRESQRRPDPVRAEGELLGEQGREPINPLQEPESPGANVRFGFRHYNGLYT